MGPKRIGSASSHFFRSLPVFIMKLTVLSSALCEFFHERLSLMFAVLFPEGPDDEFVPNLSLVPRPCMDRVLHTNLWISQATSSRSVSPSPGTPTSFRRREKLYTDALTLPSHQDGHCGKCGGQRRRRCARRGQSRQAPDDRVTGSDC